VGVILVAGVGPAPKDPEKRVRRNATVPMTELSEDGEVRGYDLPDVLGEDEVWHPQTVRWWNNWRKSAQAQSMTDVDWDFLLDTALMHHTMWSKGRWEFAAELRLRVAKFGATPEDRSRLRLRITEPEKPKPGGEPEQRTNRYGHLRPVAE
jgi:hypothetical protein